MESYKNLYDLIIVGGGPAGLSAAIYMARAKYKVLVVEKEQIGGQITITSEVVNYPGVKRKSGKELTQAMKKQAEAFGAEFLAAEVQSMELENPIRVLNTTAGIFHALGILLATGAHPRKIGFEGEAEFQGRGVAYCATCDGEFFTGREVFVIGGGFAAVEEGIFLTKYAKKVTMIVREEDFTCAKTVADEVKHYPQIEVHFQTEIVKAQGDSIVKKAIFQDNANGTTWEVQREEGIGIFVFAGYEPDTSWFSNQIELNEQGYIVTDADGKTNVDGVYAAGDVRIKQLRQVVTAVSDGAMAATCLEKYVSMIHKQENIPELPRKEVDLSSLQEEVHLAENSEEDEHFISLEIREQVRKLAEKFTKKVIVRAAYDESDLALKMRNFMQELKEITPQIICQEAENSKYQLPVLEILREDGTDTGICFHAVPGGHEFTSFVLALYEIAGIAKPIEEHLKKKIEALQSKKQVKIAVSLSCTMCPDVVTNVQKIAAMSDLVTGEMFDLQYFPDLKEEYQIMSVPCMIVDGKAYFGKKNLESIVEILTENGR